MGRERPSYPCYYVCGLRESPGSILPPSARIRSSWLSTLWKDKTRRERLGTGSTRMNNDWTVDNVNLSRTFARYVTQFSDALVLTHVGERRSTTCSVDKAHGTLDTLITPCRSIQTTRGRFVRTKPGRRSGVPTD